MKTLALFTLFCSSALAAPPVVVDLADRVAKTLPGVVNISSVTVTRARGFGGMDEFLNLWGIPQERKQSSLGSGLILDTDGYVMTNFHVIAEADEVLVTLLDKRQLRARLVGSDEKMDIALLKLQEKGKTPAGLQPVRLGDSEKIRIGDSVFAVGNPMGLQHTVTIGIISAKHRTIGQGPFDNFLQTDAAINPGNSGGPLFNLEGEVVGINTVIYSRTGQSGGLGFAIPVNEATAHLADLKRLGRVPRPWLGILSERMTPAIAGYYGLPDVEGVLAYNLVRRGPADRAGIRQGDILIAMDGVALKEPHDVERALSKRKPKEKPVIRLRRGGATQEIRVSLEELPRLDQLPPGII